MKRLAVLIAFLLLLTGCELVPNDRLYVAPHVNSSTQTSSADAVIAENYLSLKNAILSMIRTGQTEGVIHVTNYDGIVEDDLAEAAYEVSKLDPLGAYAVDYMTHSCAQIVSYYEIRINITFRRTVQEIADIVSISTQTQLEDLLQQAVNSYDNRLTLRLSSYRGQEQDIPTFVADYCAANYGTIMETPAVSISVYPESGSVRILEINFQYTNPPATLQGMQDAVQESIHAAAEYIRYRETDRDKSQLLFTYLMERFHYTAADTSTPLYDALCSGVADPTALAQAWQLICDRAGMECYTVSGMLEGEPYAWNIVSADGYYRHVDLARSMLEWGELVFLTDADMSDYYWNTETLPACEPIPEPAETPEGPTPENPADIPTQENPIETPVPAPPTEVPPAETLPAD